MTALRCIHNLNNAKSTNFDHPWVKSSLAGIKNLQLTQDIPSLDRKVITWEILQENQC